MLVDVATSDAQMLQGARRYVRNTDVALMHPQILQCWAASEIKKWAKYAYTYKV